MINHFFEISFNLLRSLGLFGSFLSMVIENLGIPLPIEIGYLVGQELINIGRHSYVVVLAVVTFGHISGATISYWIGTQGDRIIINRFRSHEKLQKIDARLKNWYKKYGNVTVFATRFIGYVRPWSSYLAGLARVPFKEFLLWTALGSLLFNIICLYLSQILLVIWRRYESFHLIIAAGAFVLFFALIIYAAISHFIPKKEKR